MKLYRNSSYKIPCSFESFDAFVSSHE